jgi:predicted ferric reductase
MSVPPAAPRLEHAKATRQRAALWLGLYLAAATLPLFALLPATRNVADGGVGGAAGAGFAWDFAMALGYAGAAMLGVQFALTARFKRATAPFGIDIVYYLHRYLALAALLIVLAHVLLVYTTLPAMAGSFDPRRAPLHMSAGRVALLAFVLLVALSLARRAVRLPYEWWRMSHAALATLGFALALAHLLGAGRYLDQPWKQALWLGYGGFWLALIVFVRLGRPWQLAHRPWQVQAVRPERGRVTTLVLQPPPGHRLDFAPGQFVWLSLAHSPWHMQEHPFSIASSPLAGPQIELSIKALGDFTAMLGGVPPGTRAWVDGPYGNFSIDEHSTAAGYVFIAGGIGIAPILSMLRTLALRGDERPLLLIYGNRVWERVAFREELDALRGRLHLAIVHVLQDAPAAAPQWPCAEWVGEQWVGEQRAGNRCAIAIGLVGTALLDAQLPREQHVRAAHAYFLCGPTPMTHAVEHSLAQLGVPAAHVHSEIFDWV